MFDSAIAAVGQTLRPRLSSLYAALASVLGLATVTSDEGPLHGLSTAWTYLSDHPSTYLNLAQLWITEHSDLIVPASWTLLVLAAGVLGFQGHVAFRTNVAATCLLSLAGLACLQVSRALMLVVLGAIVTGAAALHRVGRTSERDLGDAHMEASYGLFAVVYALFYTPLVVGAWLFLDLKGPPDEQEGPRRLARGHGAENNF